MAEFTDRQKEQLRKRAIPEDEAHRQLALFEAPPTYADLVRACTVGDGIEAIPLEWRERLVLLHEQGASQARFSKFVPASGAATRMFQDLLAGRATGEFIRNLDRFPFVDDLSAALAARGRALETLRRSGGEAEIVDALLGSAGLSYATKPKGLIPFHRGTNGARTPFAEHLAEAAATIRDAEGGGRVHFTVAPEARGAFQAHADRERRLYDPMRVEFSTQHEATDTLAGATEGGPFTTDSGELVLRPAGHGALLANLAGLGADLLFVKNIDNVQPETRRAATILWKKILGGRLVEVARETHGHVARLRAADVEPTQVEEAARFARDRFGLALPVSLPADARRRALLDALDRPIRVCGVVRNTGEPGGGPFWVRTREGQVTRQIVEPAQIDPAAAQARATFRSATHFNPVDLACAMRDAAGARFDLDRFVDPAASIVTRKSFGGREILALERPGLWNGAMAGWLTLFVEVPLETFTPVKTVDDLLRPEHQT